MVRHLNIWGSTTIALAYPGTVLGLKRLNQYRIDTEDHYLHYITKPLFNKIMFSNLIKLNLFRPSAVPGYARAMVVLPQISRRSTMVRRYYI